MSKLDDQRAMREAKYERMQARAGKPAVKAKKVEPLATRAAPAASATPAADGALCGHRSMNGRTCTREAGHAAKTHRYS